MLQRLIKRYSNAVSRFKKEDDGVTAIEFAFVGGPFLFMLLAIFETGLLLFAEYVVENGTAQAARQIRTGQVQAGSLSQAQFKALVCGSLASFLDCSSKLHVDVRKWTAFGDISHPSATDPDGNISPAVSTGASFDAGGPMEIVSVKVYYEWDLFTPGVIQLANMAGARRVIIAGATFRNEPFTN